MRTTLVLALVATSGCGSDPSIALLFPNDEALAATHRIRVEIHDPGSTGGDKCTEFARAIAEGDGPVGSPSRFIDVGFPFDQTDVEQVSRGRQLIFAWGYGDEARDSPPFLAGCTDHFDSTGKDGEAEDVALLLEHIPYPSLAIQIASGDRQIGRPGALLPRPLAVAISAISDGRTFPVAGLDVAFTTEAPFSLEGGTVERRTRTDATGIARTTVQLPTEAERGSVRATAALLENTEASFTVSALDDLEPQILPLDLEFDATSIALAAAPISGSSALDLIAVGEAEGTTRLMVAREPMSGGALLAVPTELGVDPVGVTVLENRIAIANAHLATRANAEVHLLRYEGGAIVLDQTEVLTASNAIGLASAVRIGGQRVLAVATTGRASDDASCTREDCGTCPPDEFCKQGRCVAHDGVVVLLGPDPSRAGKLREEARCGRPNPSCSATDCCLDNSVVCEIDDCACRVPPRIRIGSLNDPLDPRAIAAGGLQAPVYSDLVVPTVYGLNRLEQSPAGFKDTGTFVLTPNATAVVSDDFDLALDESADIVWVENAACAPGASTDSLCPITADAPAALGCLGLWLTEQGGPAAELKPPQTGACRRHPLSFQPSAICLADLDDDGQPDLVLSAPAERKVYVFAGDGNGGLLEPPQAFDAAGGAMLCADLDADGRAEVIIADEAQRGRFHFLSF